MNIKHIVLAVALVVVAAFVTNPDKKRHQEASIDAISENLFTAEDDLYKTSLATFYGKVLSQRLQRENYYLFSISHVDLPKNGKIIYKGFGLFGRVMTIEAPEVESSEIKFFGAR